MKNNEESFNKYMKSIVVGLDRPIIVYDTETTGLSLDTDQIIQFCGVRINLDGSTEELTFICKPTCSIHPKAAETHGRTEASLKDYKTFDKYVKQIVKLFKDCDIAGYNIDNFDNAILSRQMAENGVKDFLKDRKSYDAYKIYCRHINKKLGGAVEYYTGQTAEGCHDAFNDVKYTIMVTGAQLIKENKTVAEMVAVSESEVKNPLDKYITFNDKKEPVLNFSKHKGTKLKDVDQGFVQWVLEQDFPKELKTFLKKNYSTT